MQNQSVNKQKINFVEFRRALGAASVSEVNASVGKDAPKPMLGLILHGIYSEFVRSSKIEKNIQKCDVAILSVSCWRELDSGKSEFCRQQARLILHGIYSEFVTSAIIRKSTEKSNVAILCVSCRRELDSGKSEFCRRQARLFFVWFLQWIRNISDN